MENKKKKWSETYTHKETWGSYRIPQRAQWRDLPMCYRRRGLCIVWTAQKGRTCSSGCTPRGKAGAWTHIGNTGPLKKREKTGFYLMREKQWNWLWSCRYIFNDKTLPSAFASIRFCNSNSLLCLWLLFLKTLTSVLHARKPGCPQTALYNLLIFTTYREMMMQGNFALEVKCWRKSTKCYKWRLCIKIIDEYKSALFEVIPLRVRITLTLSSTDKITWLSDKCCGLNIS